jgi:hypothetical protein
VRQGGENSSQQLSNLSQEIHTWATPPLYLVWFVLDTTDFPQHNPPCLLLWARCAQKFARCDHWGKHDAIFAGVDGAVHQSGMFCARALAAGTSLRPQRWPGILPKLRKLLAGGAAADRSAPPHEAASTDCTAAAPQATIDFLLASRHHTRGRRRFSLRPFCLENSTARDSSEPGLSSRSGPFPSFLRR